MAKSKREETPKLGRPRRTTEASENVTVRLAKSEVAAYRAAAEAESVPLSEWIRRCCEKALARAR